MVEAAPFTPHALAQRLRALLHGRRPARLWIACSGGLDSTVLAHALAHAPALPAPLALVYVDHGLAPESGRWGRQVAQLATELGLSHRILQVTVAPAGEGLEAAARRARYRALAALLRRDEVLLTAHHADDQVETLLLRLLRGTGLDGLTGMPERRPLGAGWLLRPLLPWRRAALAAYARDRCLTWIDDPANAQLRHDRNFLRHRILPSLERRFPVAESLLRLARQAAAHGDDPWRRAWLEAAVDEAGVLHLERLPADPALQRALLGDWFRRHRLPPPSEAQRRRILKEVAGARADAQPRLRVGTVTVVRHRRRLYLLPEIPPPAAGPWTWDDPRRPLHLPGLGTLQARAATGTGLRDVPGPLVVRLRRGGERLDLGGGRRPLKKHLQEAGIPPWQRARLPLIYRGETLVAVPGLGVDRAHRAGPGEAGLVFAWRPLELSGAGPSGKV